MSRQKSQDQKTSTLPKRSTDIHRTTHNGDAGIWLCNDHPFPITVPCRFVAEYVYYSAVGNSKVKITES